MVSLAWIIPNFSGILGNTIRNLQFRSNRKIKHKFSILMRLNNHDKSIKFYFMYKHLDSVCLTFELSINNQSLYSNIKAGDKTDYHTIPGGEWHHLATFSQHEFSQLLRLGCDKLCLNLEYNIFGIYDKASSIETIENSNYLKQFLSNDQFSAIITIKNAEGKEHKVHKELLAIKSPVFKAQFEHNTIECQTNTIQTNLEKEVLDELLVYMYINKASIDWEMAKKLLAAADYYQISELKSLCVTFLYENLSPENALDTLIHADLYSAETLKNLTLEFIKFETNIEIKPEIWEKFMSVELLKDLCKFLLDSNVICFDIDRS